MIIINTDEINEDMVAEIKELLSKRGVPYKTSIYKEYTRQAIHDSIHNGGFPVSIVEKYYDKVAYTVSDYVLAGMIDDDDFYDQVYDAVTIQMNTYAVVQSEEIKELEELIADTRDNYDLSSRVETYISDNFVITTSSNDEHASCSHRTTGLLDRGILIDAGINV